MTRRLRVLLSAYACEPGKGSEPGVGWNFAVHMARHHDVWVLTRANNRLTIEAALAERPVPGLRFAYYDLPHWARFWKRGQRGVQLYHYLWQLGALGVAKRLHAEVGFDLAQHVTFVCYWKPSFLPLLGVPYVLGPVGGGESAPKAFWLGLGPRGLLFEALREAIRWLAEHDPLVRLAARRASLVLATTEASRQRIACTGAQRLEVCGESALPASEIQRLAALPLASRGPFRLVSVGRLVAWKGYHLSVRAFAEANLPASEYWIIGDGPERSRLERLAARLGVADRMRFFGQLPRERALACLGECHVLIHPSLHDSGGWVCLEAMAAGRPVICLDLGGPAMQVTEETGIKVPAHAPEQAVRDLARAMTELAREPVLQRRVGEAGRQRVYAQFSWERRVRAIGALYERGLATPA